MNFALTQIGTVIVDNNGFHIQLEKKYIPALTGLDGYSYIQMLWWFDKCDTNFSRNKLTENKPYVPRLDRVQAPLVPDWCTLWPDCIEKSGDFDWKPEFNF